MGNLFVSSNSLSLALKGKNYKRRRRMYRRWVRQLTVRLPLQRVTSSDFARKTFCQETMEHCDLNCPPNNAFYLTFWPSGPTWQGSFQVLVTYDIIMAFLCGDGLKRDATTVEYGPPNVSRRRYCDKVWSVVTQAGRAVASSFPFMIQMVKLALSSRRDQTTGRS